MDDQYATSHPELIERALRGYLRQLRELGAELRPRGSLGRIVAEAISMHELALERRDALRASEIPLVSEQLAGLSEWQKLAILDQCAVGYGRDDARILVMGTEEAYEAAEGSDLAIACSMSVLWLTGSRADILERIDPRTANKARPGARPFHLHPNDYYRVQDSRGRSTWGCLARVFRPSNAASLLALPPAPTPVSLGDLCYQIDVSAYPSKRAVGGRKPTPQRTQFLCELVEGFDQARLLLFHGGPWDEPRQQIASAFLGCAVDLEVREGARRWMAWQKTPRRAVLHTYALSGQIRYEYLDAVNAKIRELAPDALREEGEGSLTP